MVRVITRIAAQPVRQAPLKLLTDPFLDRRKDVVVGEKPLIHPPLREGFVNVFSVEMELRFGRRSNCLRRSQSRTVSAILHLN
jgi:hypothetical protein